MAKSKLSQNKTTTQFESIIRNKPVSKESYVFHLYVTGTNQASRRALINIKRICEKYLKGHYKLEVIDIYQKPELIGDQQVIAVPTLIKVSPLPLRKLIGDLSNETNVLYGLGLCPEPKNEFTQEKG